MALAKTVGFYLLGRKAYTSLLGFIEEFGSKNIAYVVIGTDSGVSNDFSKDISDLCDQYNVSHFERNQVIPVVSSISFAIGWRWMLDDTNLTVFHDSILPKYRGFAPLVNMLIEGEEKIGVTALLASSEYDRGDILGCRQVEIQYPIKIDEAISLVSELYASLLCEVYREVLNGKQLKGEVQDESLASYSIWRDASDYYINWAQDSSKIKRTIDALGYPYEGAKSYIGDEEIIINEVEVLDDVLIQNRDDNIGKIIFMNDGLPVVICGQGLVLIKSVTKLDGSVYRKFGFRSRFGKR